MTKLKAIDVCAGAGGWAVACRDFPIEIVAAFDMQPDCAATYALNHPCVEVITCDVLTMDFARWRGVDVILGGIPCETLSVARNNALPSRKELKLFRRLLGVFLGLPALLSCRHWCFEEVAQVIPYLPKGTPYLDLNSALWSAQRRRRVYLGNVPLPEIQASAHPSVLRDHLRPGPHRLSPRIHNRRLPSKNRTGKLRSTTYYPCEPSEKSPTVQVWGDSRRDHDYAVIESFGPRQWDWKEAATLQGFPLDYVFVGNPGRVAKMVAQAVQIDTARAILKGLFP